jgi:hypothetical protein
MPKPNYPDNNSSNFSFKKMPRPQKTAVLILSALGIVIVFFGILQLRNRINSPFQVDISGLNNTDVAINSANKDTDGDGLLDYDEFNTYKTSPYLEDTDSDGLLDGVEVKNGTDPNCPVGQDCYGSNNFAIATGTTSNLIANSGDGANSTSTIGSGSLGTINVSSSTSETDLKNTLAGQVDAATLRKILLENGADKNTLDAISDEDLLKSYQEVLNNQ